MAGDARIGERCGREGASAIWWPPTGAGAPSPLDETGVWRLSIGDEGVPAPRRSTAIHSQSMYMETTRSQMRPQGATQMTVDRVPAGSVIVRYSIKMRRSVTTSHRVMLAFMMS